MALVKGAPEWVLEQCHALSRRRRARSRRWTPDVRERILDRLRDPPAARRCGRWRSPTPLLPPETPADEDGLHALREALEAGLVFVGFVAIRDPLRDDVKEPSTSAAGPASR